ncbi:MAG: peptidoglycan editing factor PgeF [Gammaproteobacteria bacterium]|nr:peptidoglycan editing factor PgeF [Gammaproteobacteria bacterium]
MLKPNWQVPDNIQAITICRNDKLSDVPNLPKKLAWLQQVHSNISTKINLDLFNTNYQPITADASYTVDNNVVCLVKTADCLPILLCSNDGSWIAAIHAGWRGLANNIIENTILNFNNKNLNKNIIAWLGPAISKSHFEVGEDVYETFTGAHFSDKVAFDKSTYQSDKWYADLYSLAKLRLVRLGVKNIFTDNYCTYGQPELFYSYRRDQGTADRLITLIWKDF